MMKTNTVPIHLLYQKNFYVAERSAGTNFLTPI